MKRSQKTAGVGATPFGFFHFRLVAALLTFRYKPECEAKALPSAECQPTQTNHPAGEHHSLISINPGRKMGSTSDQMRRPHNEMSPPKQE